MRIIGWISTMAAVCALAACDAPDTATPDAEPSATQASDPAPVIDPEAMIDSSNMP